MYQLLYAGVGGCRLAPLKKLIWLIFSLDIRLRKCWGRISSRDAFDHLQSLYSFDADLDSLLCCHLCLHPSIFHDFIDETRLNLLDVLSLNSIRALDSILWKFS